MPEFIPIDLEALTVTYRRSGVGKVHALRELNLRVERSEVYGYLGPNGAGKTTTIKTLLGLIDQTGGSANLMGMPAHKPQSRERVGFLPENPYFYPFLTPTESLHFFGRMYGVERKTRQSRMDELFDLVGITAIKDRKVDSFSKGQRQRFGLAQALINDPALVILDEPLSGLDPMGRNQFKAIIRQLHERGITVFFSSHILSDVQDLCTRIGLLHAGELREEGTVNDLLESAHETDLEAYFVERFSSWGLKDGAR